MEKNQYVTVEQLINEGFKHLINYGDWQVWARKDERIYYNPASGKIEEKYVGGERK